MRRRALLLALSSVTVATRAHADHLVSGQGLRPKLGEAAAGRWRGHFPEWTPFEVTATCPPDAKTMAIGVEMHYTFGTVWLDDLSLYAAGNSTDDIADQCCLSHRGAEYRLRCAADALDCSSIRKAAVEAARAGLI